MKVQILNLDAMSGESWFKSPIPVSRSAMNREPLASADGFSAAGLLCGGAKYEIGRSHYSERQWDALLDGGTIEVG